MFAFVQKAFWIPHEDSGKYPTFLQAMDAISKYCVENGYPCTFTAGEKVEIDGKKHEICRGYAARGNDGIKCREK